MGNTPDPTLWDAVYEPGNVSTVHIGRFPTMNEAMSAAAQWFHDNTLDDRGPVFWERMHGPLGWRLSEEWAPDTESGVLVRFAGSERLFLCPSCETNQPLDTSNRRDDVGQRWCFICNDATPPTVWRTPVNPDDLEMGPRVPCEPSDG